MSNSLHVGVRNAVAAALSALPSLADGGVVVNRSTPMAKQYAKQIRVFLETSSGQPIVLSGQPQDWTTRIRVEHVARAASADENATDLADALACAATERVLADMSLGGLVQHIQPKAIGWFDDEADTSIATVQVIYEAVHRTSGQSIAA
jgi:uncharacterized protein (DUF433 family)